MFFSKLFMDSWGVEHLFKMNHHTMHSPNMIFLLIYTTVEASGMGDLFLSGGQAKDGIQINNFCEQQSGSNEVVK
jgi:hypothetical protein